MVNLTAKIGIYHGGKFAWQEYPSIIKYGRLILLVFAKGTLLLPRLIDSALWLFINTANGCLYCQGGSRGRGRMGGGMASSGGRRGGGRGSRGFDNTRDGGMAGSKYQLQLDEMAFRECMEEQAREQARIDAEQERFDKEMREEREWEEKQDYFNPANFREDLIEEAPFNQAYAEDTTDVTTENIDEAPAMETSETTDVSAMVEDLSAPVVDKGKGKESVEDQASSLKKKRGRPPSHIDGIRIYHKNRERSERIANIKEKKAFQFDKHGTGSTPDKAFDVDD
ncbi:hypothetical protein Tco_0783879 [Tanacetum coccineum]